MNLLGWSSQQAVLESSIFCWTPPSASHPQSQHPLGDRTSSLFTQSLSVTVKTLSRHLLPMPTLSSVTPEPQEKLWRNLQAGNRQICDELSTPPLSLLSLNVGKAVRHMSPVSGAEGVQK